MPTEPAAVADLASAVNFPSTLPEEDGEPLESDWHRLAINLLIEAIVYFLRERRDFYAGGNMFLYFSAAQVRNKDYRGPDFFFVRGVPRDRERRYWAVWEEDGRYPNVIVELLSPSTAQTDRTTKKALYEKTFRTPEYILYDPDTRKLEGWHLTNGAYEPMELDERGWLWSRQLELHVGLWDGSYLETKGIYLRFFDVHGNLVLTGREDQHRRADDEKQRADDEKRSADKERQRAEDEKQRADDAERRAKRLAERLRALGIDPDAPA
jgi:Uma2 family endonuclease